MYNVSVIPDKDIEFKTLPLGGLTSIVTRRIKFEFNYPEKVDDFELVAEEIGDFYGVTNTVTRASFYNPTSALDNLGWINWDVDTEWDGTASDHALIQYSVLDLDNPSPPVMRTFKPVYIRPLSLHPSYASISSGDIIYREYLCDIWGGYDNFDIFTNGIQMEIDTRKLYVSAGQTIRAKSYSIRIKSTK